VPLRFCVMQAEHERTWRTIQADPRVRVAIELGTMGACLVGGDGELIRIALPLPG